MSSELDSGMAQSAGGSEVIGGLIRDERLRAQKNQEELARTIGCSKSQLSLMESGRRAVTLDWARRIERALGIRDSRVTWAVQWQRVPAELRARMRVSMEDHRSLRARMRRALAKNSMAELRTIVDEAERAGGNSQEGPDSAAQGIRNAKKRAERGRNASGLRMKQKDEDAHAGGAHVGAETAGLTGRPTRGGAEVIPQETFARFGKQVPVINKVAAGYPREFTDLDYPASVADEYITCPDVSDADAFAARVVGDSMEPAYREGDIVVFSPRESAKSGSDCFVRLERDNETTFKRVYVEEEGKKIRLQPLNSAYAARVVPREEVGGMYAAVYVMRKVGG